MQELGASCPELSLVVAEFQEERRRVLRILPGLEQFDQIPRLIP